MRLSRSTATLSRSVVKGSPSWPVACEGAHGSGQCWCETRTMADVWRIMSDDSSPWTGHKMRGTIVTCTGGMATHNRGRQ